MGTIKLGFFDCGERQREGRETGRELGRRERDTERHMKIET